MRNKIVLISGGAGFLGSHLCDFYINKGYKVIALDNLSTGSKANIKHLNDNKQFQFIKKDICQDISDIVEAIGSNDVSIVANLASPASPPHYQRLSLETLAVGATGTLNMLELARKYNARFFHASTSEVYGDPEIHPQIESYKGSVNSYGPRSMYDEAKRYSEALIYAYRGRYPEVSTCIGRFFNTYGPRMDANDGRVVSNFIVQALFDKPLTVYGDGNQTRSFCYVDDLIEGITKLIESSESNPMNLGNPGEFTIKQLAEKVINLTKSKSQISYCPLPGDDPLQRKPDISYAKRSLNWAPEIKLETGLERTIRYFRNVAGA